MTETTLTRTPWTCRLRPATEHAIRPSADQSVLTRAFNDLGAGPVRWAVEAGAALLADLTGTAATARGVETELLSLLLQLHHRTPVAELVVAGACLDDARQMARTGVPVVVVAGAVWRQHVLVQEAMSDAAEPPGWDDLQRLTRYSELAGRAVRAASVPAVTTCRDRREDRRGRPGRRRRAPRALRPGGLRADDLDAGVRHPSPVASLLRRGGQGVVPSVGATRTNHPRET